MESRKYLVWNTLSILLLGMSVYTKDICTNVTIKKPLDGYYCTSDTNTVQLSNVPYHLCTHYCISVWQCPMLSYYENKAMCLVYREICVVMVKGTEEVFRSIMLYEPPKNECISWLPYQGSDPSGERLVYKDSNYLIRQHHNNEILPGKVKKPSMKVRTVSLFNGPIRINKEANSKTEFLVVSDVCSIAWVPYVAGNEMPSRAVVGGQTVDGRPLFVASLWTADTSTNMGVFGYYDPETKLGYATTGGQTVSNSSVNIMVEIWDIDKYINF